jgi:hypothetical protein
VAVTVLSPLGALNLSDQPDGGSSWSTENVTGFEEGSSATVTCNNGSENVAVFDLNGELDFYWRDSAGNFQKEVVAAAGTI